MVLAADDLPENLAGFTLTESKVIPNEVQANTGGDDEPVTLDDPNYGQNLAQLNSWGRQSGYRVTFTQEEQGGLSIDIRVQLDLAETETGAHAYFADWFVGDNPTSPLGIGDESHRSFTSLESSSGDIEGMGIAFAQFRTGRIIGSVSVSTNGDKGSEAKDTARELARLLFDKIQERL
jgi:hypothetical protein